MSITSILMIAVGIGAVILGVSAVKCRRLYTTVPKSLQSKWLLLTLLICCFLLGYSGYILVLFTNIGFPLEILVSTIFLGGAIFVHGIISLANDTFLKLKSLNDNLEATVERRTGELTALNTTLRESEKALARQNAFMGSVFNAITDPFYVVDAHTYQVELANSAAGIDITTPVRTCHVLTHGSTRPCEHDSCPIKEIEKTGRSAITEHIHLGGDGRRHVFEVHGFPIFDESGKLSKVIEHCIDITEKRVMEEALIRAKQLAESASKAKSEFLANMSHEIRTPMNAILGLTYLALQTDLDQVQRNYIEKVHRSTVDLLGIIDDILDFSKMEAGQLHLRNEPFDMRALMDEVVSTLSVLAARKGLQITTAIAEGLPSIWMGDDMRLRQILLNLIGNAIKFTTSGSVSTTVTRAAESEDDTKVSLHFTVADTGIGIPTEKLSSIFNSFEQTETSFTRKYGGTGLGLSICKQLVKMMEGKIWAESDGRSGSTFHFIIRLSPSTQALPSEPSSSERGRPVHVGALRILIVDDNEVNLDVARMMLFKNNRVATAENGVEAMKILAREDFDIILMDVQMPDMDGLTTTARIRALEKGEETDLALPGHLTLALKSRLRGRHIPIVAMTAYAMDDDKQRCLAAGMDDYIRKPFQYNQMISVLHKATKAPETQRETTAPVHVKKMTDPIFLYLKTTTNLADEQIEQIEESARRNFRSYLADAANALQAKDYPSLRHHAHRLKGILLQCGLPELAEKAQQVDVHARSLEEFPYSETLAEIAAADRFFQQPD